MMLFIVGAQKSGTTTLADILNQHPDFYLYPEKEPNFFGSDLTRHIAGIPEEEYQKKLSEAQENQIVIDASTSYLISKSAPSEIKKFDPNAKIIIILRDPIEMLHSWHSQMLLTGNESEADFDDALSLETERKNNKKLPPGVIIQERLYYTDIGKYKSQVQRYLDAFEEKNVKIIIFEEFTKNPAQKAQEISSFCQLDHNFEFQNIHKNKNQSARFGWLKNLRRKYTKSKTIRPLLRKHLPTITKPAGRLYNTINTKELEREKLSEKTEEILRQELKPDAIELENIISMDIKNSWETLFKS